MVALCDFSLGKDLHLAVSALGIPYGKSCTVNISGGLNRYLGSGIGLHLKQSDSPYDIYQLFIGSEVTADFDINKAHAKSCAYATNGSYIIQTSGSQDGIHASQAIQNISKQLQDILITTEFERLFKALNVEPSSFKSLEVSRYGIKITVFSIHNTKLTINSYFCSEDISAIELVHDGYNRVLNASDIAQLSGGGSATIRFAVKKISSAFEDIGKIISV